MAEQTTASSWHQLEAGQVMAELTTDLETGLTEREAQRRLAEVGPNQLAAAEKVPWWRMLLAQFQDFMVLVLLGATAVSYAMGETADAITIVVIVLVNAVLGFIQEYRAEQSLEALKQLAAPTARLRRDGQEVQVPAADMVPGDILLLEAGDKLPADGRLVEAVGLEVEEAALTGESLPVRKNPAWSGADDTGLGDRKNMVYMGTTVTRGRGTAVVVATGMTTEMGHIAGMMQAVEQEETPLQKRLEQLGKWLVLICLAVCALVVVVGLLTTPQLTREDVTRLFLSGVSLAVAAIPEGLPAIVTVALALGVQRMIKRNAIVRKLQAVETLGCATVICSDKTGWMDSRWKCGVEDLPKGWSVKTEEGRCLHRPSSVADFTSRYRTRGIAELSHSTELCDYADLCALCDSVTLPATGEPDGIQGHMHVFMGHPCC